MFTQMSICNILKISEFSFGFEDTKLYNIYVRRTKKTYKQMLNNFAI